MKRNVGSSSLWIEINAHQKITDVARVMIPVMIMSLGEMEVNGHDGREDISVPLPWHEIMGFRMQDAKTDKPKEYYSESIHEN